MTRITISAEDSGTKLAAASSVLMLIIQIYYIRFLGTAMSVCPSVAPTFWSGLKYLINLLP